MADDDDKRVFDVAKPGKTAATPTARPIIVGHGSSASDPMVKADTASNDVKVEATPIDETVELKDASKEEPKRSVNRIGAGTTIQPLAKKESDEEAQKSATDDDKETNDDTNLPGPKLPDKSPEEIASEKDAKIQELVESKEYALPIKGVATKKSRPKSGKKNNSVQIFVLLLIIFGLYVAIDLGKLDIGVDVPHIFGKVKTETVIDPTPAPAPAKKVTPAPSATPSPTLKAYVVPDGFITSTGTSYVFSYPKDWKIGTDSTNALKNTTVTSNKLTSDGYTFTVLIATSTAATSVTSTNCTSEQLTQAKSLKDAFLASIFSNGGIATNKPTTAQDVNTFAVSPSSCASAKDKSTTDIYVTAGTQKFAITASYVKKTGTTSTLKTLTTTDFTKSTDYAALIAILNTLQTK
jgi:hypothetical protein